MGANPSLRRLLSAGARDTLDEERVAALLNPAENLRVLPLETTFRELNGDILPRRMRLWNTLGYLWIEAEHWDFDGGRFYREVLPVCRIRDAAEMPVPTGVRPIEIGYCEKLRRAGGDDSARQLRMFRNAMHWSIEATLTEQARRYSFGAWPALTDEERHRGQSSRKNVVELWIDGRSLIRTALETGGPEAVAQDEPGYSKETPALRKAPFREVLREAMGQPAALSYTVHETIGEDGASRCEMEERYTSRTYEYDLAWRYGIETPTNQRFDKGVFFPLDTLKILLEDQGRWSHWAWIPSTDLADLSTLCRGIHPSGDFTRIRDYLGGGAPVGWHEAITRACKWDCFALIASCALHPRRNQQISRRLKIQRQRSEYFRLFYNGGVLIGVIAKHLWASGWGVRPLAPSLCTNDFQGITGRSLEEFPPPSA